MRVDFQSRRQSIKEALPKECGNCGEMNNLHIHHVVPIALGGTNEIGNLAVLCELCHGKIHDVNFTRRRKLQAEGIAAAKRRGQHLGRPAIKWQTLNDDTRHLFITQYNRWKAGEQTAVESFRSVGMTKSTFYKIVKEYESEVVSI